VKLTHSDALELIAKSFGFDNWNILAAKLDEPTEPAGRAARSRSTARSAASRSTR